jgi:plastocyanin
MAKRTLGVTLMLLALTAVQAADIQGTVIIKRVLTKKKVTPTTTSYDRGVAVELGSDPQTDPLATERARVVIYLEGELPSKSISVTLEQKNRRFVPETIVVPAGSTVSFPNRDPIFHNVFSLSKVTSFDLGNYPKDQTRTVRFAKPGIVFVGCRLHANMGAVIVVSPNQWSTLADGTGKFTLADVPPGTYTAVAWHKTAGFFRKTVKIEENKTTQLEFFIPLDEIGADKTVAKGNKCVLPPGLFSSHSSHSRSC